MSSSDVGAVWKRDKTLEELAREWLGPWDEEWSADDIEDHEDSVQSLAMLLERVSCRGCHMVNGVCPHCGNCEGPP